MRREGYFRLQPVDDIHLRTAYGPGWGHSNGPWGFFFLFFSFLFFFIFIQYFGICIDYSHGAKQRVLQT